MRFDETQYRSEMRQLIRAAASALAAEYPDLRVYSVSIWTDPDAATSAVSIDTRENSDAKLGDLTEWARANYARMRDGGHRQSTEAALRIPSRNINPAGFALRDLVEIEHRAFEPHWAAQAGVDCWEVLEPALAAVLAEAPAVFEELLLDPEAEVGVNTRHDWYGLRRPLVERAT